MASRTLFHQWYRHGSLWLQPSSLRGGSHCRILACQFSSQPPRSPPPTGGGIQQLRRPAGYQGTGNDGGSETPQDPSKAFGLRSNIVTLFPGDFSDRDSDWDDLGMEDSAFLDDDGSREETAATAIQQALREKEARDKLRKAKWLENAKPPVRKSMIDARGRSFGKGGRKAAKATAFIQPGLGEIVVNNQDYLDYFRRRSDRDHLLTPMVVTETLGAFDVQISVRGGGLTGQAGAARLCIANALNAYNPDLYRPPLKRLGLLERDARKVERKKIGKVKARKSPQWVRR